MFQIEFDSKQIQQALPDYKYVKRLGSGAFATVHLVQNRKTGDQSALKKISCFGMGEYQKAGAANEVRILSSLDHKNIIKVDSCLFDSSEDVMYIFLEYADSGDLTSLIDQAKQKKKRIPEMTVWKALHDVSDGLRYIHKSQIIHRDIKPANIFRKGKNFKIGDMNVSKIVKNGVGASTKTGSPLYSAPEVWDSQQYDNKCDIWSLGALIYEMCTLKVPFQADNVIQLTNKMKNQKPRPLPTVYTSALDDLVKRMLDVNPVRRITAEDIYEVSRQKLKIQTDNLDEGGIQNMMDTLVFPDTHQRWVNLIPHSLPPKTTRKQVSISQINERSSKSKQKTMENNSSIFRSTERKPINLPKSKSRSRIENPPEVKGTSFPPIYRSGSPVSQRKISQDHQSSQKRAGSQSSKNHRKSITEFVQETKSELKQN